MVEIEKLVFGYGREPLFKELDLAVVTGNIYGLLGRNGAGKTTLLKVISGLLFPQAGDCRVFGENPGRRSPSLLREI